MNHKNIWAVLFLALSTTACTQDENVVSGLPTDTPIRIITLLDDEETVSRADTEELPITYAEYEIHSKSKVNAKLYKVEEGTISEESKDATNALFSKIEFDGGVTLEDYPEDTWTIMEMTHYVESGSPIAGDPSPLPDKLYGWSQVKVLNDEPVLVYSMRHTNAKITIHIQEEGTEGFLNLSQHITATVSSQPTESKVISVAAAEASEPFEIILVEDAGQQGNGSYTLEQPVSSEQPVTSLTGLVPATVTHTEGINGGYDVATASALGDDEYLQVVVEDDFFGTDNTSNQVGGTYRIALKDIKMGGGSTLNKLEAGKHYIITLTLTHNKLVGATASLGNWTKYTATGNLPGDESKVPTVSNP